MSHFGLGLTPCPAAGQVDYGPDTLANVLCVGPPAETHFGVVSWTDRRVLGLVWPEEGGSLVTSSRDISDRDGACCRSLGDRLLASDGQIAM